MAKPDITLTLTIKVNPADIANLEGLARDAQALADRLRVMTAPDVDQRNCGDILIGLGGAPLLPCIKPYRHPEDEHRNADGTTWTRHRAAPASTRPPRTPDAPCSRATGPGPTPARR